MRVRKNTILYFFIVFLVANLISCKKTYFGDNNSIDTQRKVSHSEGSKKAGNNIKIDEHMDNFDKLEPEVKVIIDYIESLNNKNYSKAFNDLGDILKESYVSPDNNTLKSIEHIELVTLIDKTDNKESSIWFVNPREVGDIYDYRVFFAEMNYKIDVSSLKDGYLQNGANYFKVITAKEKEDSSWKIVEMSMAEKEWKDCR